MKQSQWQLVTEFYHQTNLALWAVACAFVIVVALFVAPSLPASQAKYERAVAAQAETEHDFYCQRWGFSPGTRRYLRCMADLMQFRRNVEKKLSDEFDRLP